MADVLRGIMGVENQPYGILRISSPGSNVSGRLAIADSQFVVGAMLSDGTITGYDAIRRLLLAVDGNFAYLDSGTIKPQDFEQGLYISLQKLADLWPNLPANQAELFDEKALLDKVFGSSGKMPPDPSSGHVLAIRPEDIKRDPNDSSSRRPLIKAMQEAASTSGKQGNNHKQAWKTVVQPLLSNSLVDSGKNGAISGGQSFYGDLDDTATHHNSLTRLRAQRSESGAWYKELFAESFLSKQALVWLGIIFAVSLVATLVGLAAVNNNNSLTIQKSVERSQP